MIALEETLPEVTPTPSPNPTAVTDVVTTVATADYTQLLTDISIKLDTLTSLMLFSIGCLAAVLVCYVLYQVIDNFVSY